MDTNEPKVRIGHERSDLLHLLDQVLHGDLMLVAAFTRGAVNTAVEDAREAIRSAMVALDKGVDAWIDFAEIRSADA